MHAFSALLASAIQVSALLNTSAVNIEQSVMADLTASISDTTPVSKTFAPSDVSAGADTVTIAAHGFATGLKVQLTTTGTLPVGLATSTNYYLIVVDSSTLKFATSQANALAGTAIDLTDGGSGTHTIAPQAISCSVKLQKSDEPWLSTPIWFDIVSSSQSCPSLPGTLNWPLVDIGSVALRAVVTTTSGAATVSIRGSFKGP